MGLPRGLGDWMALFSGMGWAYLSVRLRRDKRNEAEDLTLSYFLTGTVIALETPSVVLDKRMEVLPVFEIIRFK